MNKSDSEENFINLDNLIEEYDMYQIQINNEELIIRKIGKSKQSNDIIIYKNDKGLTLYSIVYSSEELKYNKDLGNIFNLMKIHEKVNKKDILFTGTIMKDSKDNYWKIYKFSGNDIYLHPINKVNIESRDEKKYKTSKNSLNQIFIIYIVII